jgi:hypothetical protein
MRNYLILLLLFLTGQLIYSQNTETYDSTNYRCIWDYPNSKTPIENSIPLRCKVFRIKETDEAYIIDIDIKDKTRYFRYTIISLKRGQHVIDIKEDDDYYIYTMIYFKNEKKNLKKIKRGKRYDFVLFAYYPFETSGDPIYRRGTIYTIEGVPITFIEDFKTGKIVTTPNLKGLYYVP